MIFERSLLAVMVFVLFVGTTLGLSFYFARKARSAAGYFAASGGIHWFVNGVAFAGDYLSAASFLGICGMIAFYGYDGFLYSIGYLAGWVVALFVIAEPVKRLGRFTLADALDSRFRSRGIRLATAVSTLVVSLLYLIPQMVGAGSLIKPLFNWPHEVGVGLVGAIVILIVVTAGMVSTTYVQFIKGGLLVVFSLVLTVLILARGISVNESAEALRPQERRVLPSGEVLIDGAPRGLGEGQKNLRPVGHIARLPGGQKETGPLDPISYFTILSESQIVLWKGKTEELPDKTKVTTWTPDPTEGSEILSPGRHPIFKGLRANQWRAKLDFLSLMLALFCGTASLPHILIRYYTVKDSAAARKSTVVGIASIGFFYVLTLFLGLGAMTSGSLDLTDQNMSAPLLARSFGELLFAVISAIAFTTVLGTVSGLIVAASGAVVHDLLVNVARWELTDHEKVRLGRIVAVVVGVAAMVLGVLFKDFNASFLVGWAFSVAASANLPSLIMLLFWKRTTKQGITAAIVTGMVSSLAWILASSEACEKVYKIAADRALVPFTQPGIITIPLGFAVLVAVSLSTQPKPGVDAAH